MSMDICEEKNHNIPIPMVHENIHIDLTNYMDPSKKLGNPILWVKNAKIVSRLEKAHNILFKNQKVVGKKNLKKQKH